VTVYSLSSTAAAAASTTKTSQTEIKIALIVPAASDKGKFQPQWIDKIQSESQGKIKITPYGLLCS